MSFYESVLVSTSRNLNSVNFKAESLQGELWNETHPHYLKSRPDRLFDACPHYLKFRQDLLYDASPRYLNSWPDQLYFSPFLVAGGKSSSSKKSAPAATSAPSSSSSGKIRTSIVMDRVAENFIGPRHKFKVFAVL